MNATALLPQTQPLFCADCDDQLEGRGIQRPDGRWVCRRCDARIRRTKQDRAQGDLFTEQRGLFNPIIVTANVAGFRDASGGFHPIRKSETYNEFLAGDFDNDRIKERRAIRQRERERADEAAIAEFYRREHEREAKRSRGRGKHRPRSLSQFVRAQGGMVPGGMYAGEVRRLGRKESGTTGLINQHARQGSHKQTPEYVMDAANVAGYRDTNGREFSEIGAFISAVEADAGGQRKYYAHDDLNEMNPQLSKPLQTRLLPILGADYLAQVSASKKDQALRSLARDFRTYHAIAQDESKELAERAAAAQIAGAVKLLSSNLDPAHNPMHPLEVMSHLAMGLTGIHTGLSLRDYFKAKRRRRRVIAVENPGAPNEWTFDDLDLDSLDDAMKLGSAQARALGKSSRAAERAPKLFVVTWHSKKRDKRTGFIRPIPAHNAQAAIKQAKAMITNDKTVSNFVAEQVQANSDQWVKWQKAAAKRAAAESRTYKRARDLYVQAKKKESNGDTKGARRLYTQADRMLRRADRSGNNVAGPIGRLPNGVSEYDRAVDAIENEIRRVKTELKRDGVTAISKPNIKQLIRTPGLTISVGAYHRAFDEAFSRVFRSFNQRGGKALMYRTNPGASAAVNDFSKMFHGRANGAARDVIVSRRVRQKNFARLGALPYIKMVHRPRGHSDPRHACGECAIVLNPSRAFLMATPSQPYRLVLGGADVWRAGKQLRAAFLRENPAKTNGDVKLGRAEVLFYRTAEKHSNSGVPILYYHPTAEETRRNADRPFVCVDTDGMLYLQGGRYHIDERGIIN
jgi:hypothetical protein